MESSPQPTEFGEDRAENSANATQSDSDGNSNATSNAHILIESKEKEKFLKPPTPKRKKKHSTPDSKEDHSLQAALNFLQQPDDPASIYSQHLATKLRQFSGRTRAMVEHGINQIIFEAEMGHYDNPPPHSSPYPSEGSPWSAYSGDSSSPSGDNSSNSTQGDGPPQATDTLLNELQPYIAM